MPPHSCPPVQNRHPPGNVGPLGTSSPRAAIGLDEIAPGNSADEPVLVPPRQCPHTPAHPFRTATPPRERRASGNVEHQLDDRALWQLPGRAGARPSQAMPPTPVRPETPPFWERRPLETSSPRAAIGLDERAPDKLRGPASARPPQGSRAMRNSGSLSQRA